MGWAFSPPRRLVRLLQWPSLVLPDAPFLSDAEGRRFEDSYANRYRETAFDPEPAFIAWLGRPGSGHSAMPVEPLS